MTPVAAMIRASSIFDIRAVKVTHRSRRPRCRRESQGKKAHAPPRPGSILHAYFGPLLHAGRLGSGAVPALRKWNERPDQLVIVRGGLQQLSSGRPSSIGGFPSSSDRSSSELFEGIGSLNVSISPKGTSAIEGLKRSLETLVTNDADEDVPHTERRCLIGSNSGRPLFQVGFDDLGKWFRRIPARKPPPPSNASRPCGGRDRIPDSPAAFPDSCGGS
jgi:hypothetical protein